MGATVGGGLGGEARLVVVRVAAAITVVVTRVAAAVDGGARTVRSVEEVARL
jgi:hypothetical protein